MYKYQNISKNCLVKTENHFSTFTVDILCLRIYDIHIQNNYLNNTLIKSLTMDFRSVWINSFDSHSNLFIQARPLSPILKQR